jgi:hypothetical protein
VTEAILSDAPLSLVVDNDSSARYFVPAPALSG